MKQFGCSLLIVTGMLAGTWQTGVLANDPKTMPPCEPGFQWMQVTEYQEVCRDVCRVVPDVKKTTKWVYCTIDDPFCTPKCSCGHHHGHHDCDPGCPACHQGCHGPHHRKQLVKRAEVCEEPTTKCVVEKIVEQVPCTVWRKVPCTTTETSPAPAAERIAPPAKGK